MQNALFRNSEGSLIVPLNQEESIAYFVLKSFMLVEGWSIDDLHEAYFDVFGEEDWFVVISLEDFKRGYSNLLAVLKAQATEMTRLHSEKRCSDEVIEWIYEMNELLNKAKHIGCD